MHRALFYKSLDKDRVECELCPHKCVIILDGRGKCRQRKNVEGQLYSTNYGMVSSIGVDPIEKKPLYHFYPGTDILSIGTTGCNFECQFCQNWSIAHSKEVALNSIDTQTLLCLAQKENIIGIAYTYNEPSIWYEFVKDMAISCKNNGLKNVMVTNGFLSQEPLKQIIPYIDGFNIDIKSFNDEYYKGVCGGSLKEVLNTVEVVAEHNHIEITTLIVNGLNDTEKEISNLTKWIASLNPNIPVHLSRYCPNYKMTREPTSKTVLYRLRDIAREHLNHVYVGNVQDADNRTYCPKCDTLLIDRETRGTVIGIKNAQCLKCSYNIFGYFCD